MVDEKPSAKPKKELSAEKKEQILGIAGKLYNLGKKDAENTKLKEKIAKLQADLKTLKASGKTSSTSELEKLAKRIHAKVSGGKSKATMENWKKLIGKVPNVSTDDDVLKVGLYSLELMAKMPPKPKVAKAKASAPPASG